MKADDVVLVTCAHPLEGAEVLAHLLVERRLAACVQVVPGLRSVYRWQGRIEAADEARLDIKTTAARIPEIEALIRARHPHDLPEILVLPVIGGLDAYLDWVRAAVEPD